jgi:hypothetical protein
MYSTKKTSTNETQMDIKENIAKHYNKGIYFVVINLFLGKSTAR